MKWAGVGFACFAFICVVGAWRHDGHSIVGQIGSAYLTPTTNEAVSRVLAGESLSTIANWPDNYDHTPQGAWSEHLHYVNIPDESYNFTMQYCTPPYDEDPSGCVVTGIWNFTGACFAFFS